MYLTSSSCWTVWTKKMVMLSLNMLIAPNTLYSPSAFPLFLSNCMKSPSVRLWLVFTSRVNSTTMDPLLEQKQNMTGVKEQESSWRKMSAEQFLFRKDKTGVKRTESPSPYTLPEKRPTSNSAVSRNYDRYERAKSRREKVSWTSPTWKEKYYWCRREKEIMTGEKGRKKKTSLEKNPANNSWNIN